MHMQNGLTQSVLEKTHSLLKVSILWFSIMSDVFRLLVCGILVITILSLWPGG